MKVITPYLYFDGNCREAMTFYQRCLGGELYVMTFGEAQSDSPPEVKDRLIHARLTRGSMILMASDTMPGLPLHPGDNVHLNIVCESDAEVDTLYAALTDGGRGVTPPDDVFWNARFAMLVDRFGMYWMLNHERAHQG